jgi:hypothetical protein
VYGALPPGGVAFGLTLALVVLTGAAIADVEISARQRAYPARACIQELLKVIALAGRLLAARAVVLKERLNRITSDVRKLEDKRCFLTA